MPSNKDTYATYKMLTAAAFLFLVNYYSAHVDFFITVQWSRNRQGSYKAGSIAL